MKLRNKLAAITASAMLLFAGAGFAAWTFTSSVNDNANVAGEATAAIEASGLRVTDGADHDITALYLICDAPSGQTGLVAGNGIYWSTENSNDYSKKIESLTLVGSVNEDDNDILDFSTYTGHFAANAFTAIAGTWVNIAATSALDQNVTSTTKNDDVEYVWTLPVPSYAAVPADVSEVNALETEVNALSLTFSFTFNVDHVNA